ncbi:hypothetical protein GCM10008967_42970 [Bacillus carboniphilus]|uniref:Uncharacterized protein n=1 Tax=Bacillus carboniphilus TaxID=86663 RepID=A0ABP3GMI6_9BACI
MVLYEPIIINIGEKDLLEIKSRKGLSVGLIELAGSFFLWRGNITLTKLNNTVWK